MKSSETGNRRASRRSAKVAAEANGGVSQPDRVEYATSLGYSKEELKAVPADAVVSHGCGTPVPHARLKRGEVVLDLGSGAGLDVFQAEPYVPLAPDKDLRQLDNVLLTPHVGSNTREANRRMAEASLANARAFLAGRLDQLTRVDGSPRFL